MKLFKKTKKSGKSLDDYISQSLNGVYSRANTVNEIKEMLSTFGDDDTKVLFKDSSGKWVDFILVQKSAVNKNAGQLRSENPKPIEMKKVVLITIG